MRYMTQPGVRRLLIGAGAITLVAGLALALAGRPHPAVAQGARPAPATVIGTAPALPTLAPLVDRVRPGVVNISVTGREEPSALGFPDDPFFHRFFDGPDQSVERRYQAAGSGVIMDGEKGYILTNDHVVDHADTITVTLADRRTFSARVVGRDPDADVAVIQIPADHLTALRPADSDRLRVGDYVVAIGNPFGLNHTVTAGIVSAVGRSGLDLEGYEDFIQTDASINPGNSGGALVDLDGDLVGINTAIVGESNVGIGFAIPINMARGIMTQLIEHGKVERGQLGLLVQDVTPDVARAMRLDQAQGALVSRVEPHTPAERAGVEAGDVIVRLDSAAVRDASDLRNRVGMLPVGATVQLGLVRAGKSLTVRARLAEHRSAAEPGQDIDPRLAGVSLSSEAGPTPGVLVDAVSPGSPAYAAGLRAGDLITGIDRLPVPTLERLRDVVKDSSGPLLINAQRDHAGLFLVLR